MSLRVVFLTRSSRPSGAQMAWRLYRSGFCPVVVIVEKRGRMAASQRGSLLSLVFRLGIDFAGKRVWEALQIRSRYFLRKHFPRRFKDPAYQSIEEWALDHPSVRIFEVEDHNSPEVQELLWRLEPDVGVLTNTRRIQQEVLSIPRQGFLNLHLSALPQYAGLDSIFWALAHGEKEIGVTVHFASAAIDRGDVVLQRKIPVCPSDDERSLYEKALWLGTALMIQALRQLERGTIERKPQNPERGSYFSWPTGKERVAFRKRWRGREHTPNSIHRLHMLHLITRMSRGGAQENTLSSALGLAKKGYRVTLMTGPSWGEEGEILSEALEAGLEIVVIPELVREISPWKDVVAFLKILFWLWRNPCAVVHTHTSKAGLLGRLTARLRKVPVVVHTPHGHVFHSYFSRPKEKLFLAIERLAARRCDRLVALTECCRREHLELDVGTPDQWVVIPSGVDPARFEGRSATQETILNSLGIRLGSKIVGYVGRLAPVKGPSYLVKAFREIVKQHPEAHCLLVGDGEEKPFLERQILELGLEGRVRLVGHQDEVAEWLSVMDLVVVPSFNEGMGRVIVEAGFARKPVVGTKVGGIPDLIEHERTGLLVEPRDSEGIARAVMRLLGDAAFSRSLGENLREKVTRGFTETEMIEKIHRLYQEVLAEKGTAQRISSKDSPDMIKSSNFSRN